MLDSSQSKLGCAVSGVYIPLLSLLTLHSPEHIHDSGSPSNRPTSYRPVARTRQSKKSSAFTFPVPATSAASPATIAPPCTYPRVFWSFGHIHAHSSRLWRRSFPPESILLYVCQPRQARRRHGAALDEGALSCFSLFSALWPLSHSKTSRSSFSSRLI
jgi:hypothetical protein